MTDDGRIEASHATASQALVDRAQAYMDAGPGKVEVERIKQIDQVRALRECREQLTAAELEYVSKTIEQVKQVLRGIETSVAITPTRKRGFGRLLLALINPVLLIAMLGGKEARDEAEYNYARSQAGAAELPAPVGMIEAAEAWLVAALVQGRMTVDTAPLRRPWETITIAG